MGLKDGDSVSERIRHMDMGEYGLAHVLWAKEKVWSRAANQMPLVVRGVATQGRSGGASLTLALGRSRLASQGSREQQRQQNWWETCIFDDELPGISGVQMGCVDGNNELVFDYDEDELEKR
ncbi:hypothetical protein NDU88_001168 [Pleurodeles waltl]|uniref:Uncharacterized protein n=1 Tax=Pleurodeles waltl TaxID=8319 RepID=A0AAV7V7Q0_PLEWA|nr:hypothetical protein NDU88_001168 [Pleurodeles waltl]